MSKQLLERLRAKYQKVRQSKAGDGHVEYQICCPFCMSERGSPDKKFKLTINGHEGHRKYGAYHCWKCGKAGAVSDLVNFELDPTEVQLEEKVKPLTSVDVLDKVPPPDRHQGGGLTRIDLLDADHPAIQYLTRLRKRTFDPVYLGQTFGVHYCAQGQLFAGLYDTTNTLIFPIYMTDFRTRKPVIVGWQSRLLYEPDDLDDTGCARMGYRRDEDTGKWRRPPKYFLSPNIEKGRLLYNFTIARGFDTVVVTEGVFDAFAVGPAAVSTFGKGITEGQLNLLKTYWDTVILLFDPGDADKEMRESVTTLGRAVDVTQVDLVGYKDAGDAPTDEIWRQISEKREVNRQLIEVALGTTNNRLDALSN